MTRSEFLVVLGVAAAALAFGQEPGMQAPVAGRPKVELEGKIEKIQVSPGQRMPYLEVKTRDGIAKIILGSVRYLFEQNFNPKAGDAVAVKGYQVDDGVIAITVTMSSTGKVLKLRDEQGRPVWMRGRRGGPMNKSGK